MTLILTILAVVVGLLLLGLLVFWVLIRTLALGENDQATYLEYFTSDGQLRSDVFPTSK